MSIQSNVRSIKAFYVYLRVLFKKYARCLASAKRVLFKSKSTQNHWFCSTRMHLQQTQHTVALKVRYYR